MKNVPVSSTGQRSASPASEGGGWRVGSQVPINVYDEHGKPVCQCHTPEQAAKIVAAVNGLRSAEAERDAVQADCDAVFTSAAKKIRELEAQVSSLTEALRQVLTAGGKQNMSVRENRMELDAAIANGWAALSGSTIPEEGKGE